MAVTTLSVQAFSDDTSFENADTVNGNGFLNDEYTQLKVFNQLGTAVVVTFAAKSECKHGFLDDWPVTVASGQLKVIGPFKASRFNTAARHIEFQYTDAGDGSNVFVAAQRIAPAQ
jgi:hypothetical protein